MSTNPPTSGSGSASGSSTASSTSTSRFCSTGELDDKYPLWSYVSIIETRKGGGGNRRWKCNFCQKDFSGSYSRVKIHLLKNGGDGISACTKVTTEYLSELKRVVQLAEERQQARNVRVPLPGSSSFPTPPVPSFATGTSDALKRRKTGPTGPLEEQFKNDQRNQVRSEIARMFYSGGVPFHLARNPYYVSSYSMAAKFGPIDGFIPPGYNALRTTLLQRERANIERLLLPVKETWLEKGISLCSDGWSDPQRRPLINIMAACEKGAIFLRAIDTSGETKDKHFIAEKLEEGLVEIGMHNVVQIITDNAPNCKAAGLLIEGKYPNIFWTPCVVHTLNLALKNICAANNTQRNHDIFSECGWITGISDDAIFVKNFITGHQLRNAIFNKYSPLKLLSVAETRFASAIVMLKRMKLLQESLRFIVISRDWNDYKDDNPTGAQAVKDIVLNDLWWDKVDYILDFTRPIYDMLRLCDTDKPTLHLVYDAWDSMIETVRVVIYRKEQKGPSERSSFYDAVYDVLIDRWTKSCTPLHCMAHSLNPRYNNITLVSFLL
jgi:hypothetical protein